MKTPVVPNAYPELLCVLVVELAAELSALVPQMAEGDVERLAFDLVEQCRTKIGGQRVPAARGVEAGELPRADWVTYGTMRELWLGTLGERITWLPEAWAQVAACRLLDILRRTFGGLYVPKGRSVLAQRNDAMFDQFRGDFREIAVRHNISAERARQIVTERIKTEVALRQRTLF